MTDAGCGQWDRQKIEEHLKSAVSELTPNVLDRVDLSIPQEKIGGRGAAVTCLWSRMHTLGTLAAACVCMVVLAGGVYTYQNGRVDSVIGIDVNPSIELAVNRRSKVLEAQALNPDAVEIMEDMDLKGVDLNVAVNAVIGSMVQHGYLDDLDNAILVTVSNDSVSKAANLRSAVVEDIQTSLEENQVKAVVYDQQAVEVDEVKELADRYGISYGKAYFLQELIEQNPDLTTEDMEHFAPLTMEKIAQEITERSYALGERADKAPERPSTMEQAEKETSPAQETTLSGGGETAAETGETAGQVSTTAEGTTALETGDTVQSEETTGQETSSEDNRTVEIDNVDYDGGTVIVHFKMSVKWRNPSVSVRDEDGTKYAAMVGTTTSSSCKIVSGDLEGGRKYTFVLSGISAKGGKPTSVSGTFETPVIGEDATEEDPPETTRPPETTVPETTAPETATQPEKETIPSQEEPLPDTTFPEETLPPEPTVSETTKTPETKETKAPVTTVAGDTEPAGTTVMTEPETSPSSEPEPETEAAPTATEQ